MARINLVTAEQAPLQVQPFYAARPPGPIISSLAHVPELLAAAGPFIGAVFGESGIEPRLKEIVVLRVSAQMHCRYCVLTHSVIALDSGLSRDEVVALRSRAPAEATFSDPRELAVVRWSDALADIGPVPDELAAELADHLAEWEIVELTLLGGATIMLNRYCSALDLPPAPETTARLVAAGLA